MRSMRQRHEWVRPGIVIGAVASLLIVDLVGSSPTTKQAFCVLAIAASWLGTRWVAKKTRAEGRGVSRSVGVTLWMGASAGSIFGALMPGLDGGLNAAGFGVAGVIFGAPLGAGLVLVTVLPPIVWLALLSQRGFCVSRAGSFARTIWWRRRWSATLAASSGAVLVRVLLAPPTLLTACLAAGLLAIAVAWFGSLWSMRRELEEATADLDDRVLDAPGSEAALVDGIFDVGVGETLHVQRARPVAVTGAAYRSSQPRVPLVRGDVPVVQRMLRHTLFGGAALVLWASSMLALALASLPSAA